MRTPLVGCLALLLAISACHPDPGGVSAAARATARPSATVKPQSMASAAAADSRVAPPADGGTPLAGTVQIDASYLVASGSGTVLAGPDGQVALVGQQLITQDGGGIISHDGGGIISHDGGGIISHDGGGIISHDGGGLVAAGGGNLVASVSGGKVLNADGSAALVAAGGGNLVAAGGGNYRLAAAPSAPPAAGTVLPAAGLLVSVVDLTSNQYLPLGKEPGGKDVFAVYSDTKGQYQVYLPKGHASQVLVVASSPATLDSRLAYNLITKPVPKVELLDETSSLLTLFLRTALSRHLETYVRDAKSEQPPCHSKGDKDVATFSALTNGFTDRMVEAVVKTKLYDQPIERQHVVAGLMIDHAVAILDHLDEYKTAATPSGSYAPPEGSDEVAFGYMRQQLDQLNKNVTGIMRDPARLQVLEGQMKRWLVAMHNDAYSAYGNKVAVRDDGTCNTPQVLPALVAGQDLPPALEVKVRKPSDVGAYLVDALLADGYSYREGYASELFELTGLAAPPGGSVPSFGPDDDDAINALLHPPGGIDPANQILRPSVQLIRHLSGATSGLLYQLASGLQEPGLQCTMLREIDPSVACPPASPH